ncbi:MAG TPA: hypothetical protein VF483_12645 [Gemmatimonadaceae bacterium]
MPAVPFESLPAEARVWVFASDRPLLGKEAEQLLTEVDRFLAQWKAHGHPLRCAREWRDDRFLAIGVDPTAEQASGCSIDGLFRGLQTLERVLNTRLVAGGRVFYRDASGAAQLVARPEIPALASKGTLTSRTPVFDLSLTAADDYRAKFERPAGQTWVAALLPD